MMSEDNLLEIAMLRVNIRWCWNWIAPCIEIGLLWWWVKIIYLGCSVLTKKPVFVYILVLQSFRMGGVLWELEFFERMVMMWNALQTSWPRMPKNVAVCGGWVGNHTEKGKQGCWERSILAIATLIWLFTCKSKFEAHFGFTQPMFFPAYHFLQQ